MDVTINIKVDGAGAQVTQDGVGIKKIVKKKKLGRETVLQLPPTVENPHKSNPILDMLGV